MSLRDKITAEISAINPVTKEYNYADLIFPATTMEIEDAFHKARVQKNGEYFVRITSCPSMPYLTDVRIDGRIEPKEMNLLAMRLQVLPKNELTALGGLLMRKVHDAEDDTISVEDLINMTYNLKDVIVVDNVSTLSELGTFAINNGLTEILGLGKETLPYVALDTVGRKQLQMDEGEFYKGSYVVTSGYKIPSIYKTPPKEQLEIKNNIAFGLKIAEAPINSSEETVESAEWIYLPIDKNTAKEIAIKHNEGCIEDCVYFEFKSIFECVNEEIFDDMLKFDVLNEIAARYVRLDDMGRIKFKAVVEKVEPQTLNEILEISDNLNRYEHSYYSVSEGNFGEEYLARHLPTNFDMGFFDKDELHNFGEGILDWMNAGVTFYGTVSDIDRSLFEVVRYDDQEQQENQIQENDESQVEGIGGISM